MNYSCDREKTPTIKAVFDGTLSFDLSGVGVEVAEAVALALRASAWCIIDIRKPVDV